MAAPLLSAAKVEELNFDSVYKNLHAREYQKRGIKFIIDSDFNCILGDQMRLGKTPQSLLALANRYEERTPCLYVVRSANLWQWIDEHKLWADPLPLGIFPIIGSKGFIPLGFKTYIISMDTLGRKGMVDQLKAIGFKLIIADEAQSFKNGSSKRSQALVDLVKSLNTVDYTESTNQEGYRYQGLITKRKCGLILLSGGIIKNRADEFYVPLNLVAPHIFYSLEGFRRQWCVQDSKGRWSRINPHRLEAFKETIKPYYLRREKEDVYTELPPMNRMWSVIEIEDESLRRAYNAVLDDMEIDAAAGRESFMDQEGNLMKLRRICGLAKTDWIANYLEVSLDDSQSERFAVGIHHKAVADILLLKLAQYGCLKLSGADNPEQKYHIMKAFEFSKERVLVMNMVAGGIGMDFHYCNNVIILERMWSSIDEEQFEFRFYNPDKSIKTAATNVEYVVAKGTIDEWFHDMIETKRQMFGETISTNWNITQDPGSFKELLGQTLAHRL
jgi:SNF2 family DNA or RNA helicase